MPAVRSEAAATDVVSEVVAGDSADWREFVLAHPLALPYHHPAWTDVLADAYGFEPRAVVLRSEDDAVVGGLPFVEVGGRLRGRRWVSLPFTDVCPPLTGPGVTVGDVASAAAALGAERGVGGVEIRSAVPTFADCGHVRGVVHELHLGDPETLFKAFRSNTRRNVRKAESSGVTVTVGESRADLTEVYYDLHADTRRRLGVPTQPRRFFDAIWRRVIEPGHGFLLLAYHEGTPIAGAVFLDWNGRIVYKYGASDRHHWPLRPNNVIFWECIRRGAAGGRHTLDFGRTDLEDEGLRSFKDGWGALEEPLVYTGIGHASTGSGRAERLLRPIFRATPPALGRRVGAVLYRLAA